MNRRGLEWKSLPFSLKAGEGESGEFEGLASAFYCIDDSWWNDIIAPGAFTQDLPEFLASGFVGGMNHDWDCPIGRPLSAKETSEGLYVQASISDTTHGRDCRTLMKDGVVSRLSIGFRALGKVYLETAEAVQGWWSQVGYSPTPEDVAKSQYGARLLTRIRLYEFSPVAVPANRRAVIVGVKSADGERAPVPLGEHCSAALGVVEELVERLRQLEGLRAAKGGRISGDHRAGLKRLIGGLGELLERMPADGKDARALFAEFQSICTTLPGMGGE